MDEKHLDAATVSEAAAQLGVSRQRVLRLIAEGSLRARRSGHQWLISRPDLERRAAAGHPAGGRFSPSRAWGVLFLADDLDAPWLDRAARWALRRQLSEHSLPGLRGRLGLRGRPRYLRAHPGDIDRLARESEVIATGPSAKRITGIVSSGHLDAYVSAGKLADLVRRYHLLPSWEANLILREMPEAVARHISGREAPASAVALDLFEDDDPRSQEAGRRLLSRYA